MKKLLFVMTHLGSRSDIFCNWLRTSDRIDGQASDRIYDESEKFRQLGSNIHKCGNAASIYLDEIYHNHQFTCKPYIPHCKFIHFIRSPFQSLETILIEHPEYSAYEAGKYYQFRIRGIAEYALRAKNSLFLTWNDVLLSRSLVENYLQVKLGPTPQEHVVRCSNKVPQEVYQECQEVYNRYVGYLRPIFVLPEVREEKINSSAIKDLPSNAELPSCFQPSPFLT